MVGVMGVVGVVGVVIYGRYFLCEHLNWATIQRRFLIIASRVVSLCLFADG